MKTLTSLVAALALGLTANLAFAGDGAPGDKGDKAKMDCSKMTDDAKKAKCEAHQAAMEKCKDLKGEDNKKCMMDNMPKPEDKK
jgi:hypothetical protein